MVTRGEITMRANCCSGKRDDRNWRGNGRAWLGITKIDSGVDYNRQLRRTSRHFPGKCCIV